MNSYTYTPFGELLTGEDSGFRFSGEYYDSATGMVNLRARQYEPAVMRFVQRDLLKGDQSAPLSLNRYLYCMNDPIGYYDRSGNRVDEDAGKPKKVTPCTNASKAIPFSGDSAQSQRQEQFAIQKIKSANRQLENAFGRVGLDTGNSNDAISQEIEKAQQEIARKAANGTLTVKERNKIIRKACTSAVLKNGWEDIKQNIKEKILQKMGEWLSQQAQAAYDTFIDPIFGVQSFSREIKERELGSGKWVVLDSEKTENRYTADYSDVKFRLINLINIKDVDSKGNQIAAKQEIMIANTLSFSITTGEKQVVELSLFDAEARIGFDTNQELWLLKPTVYYETDAHSEKSNTHSFTVRGDNIYSIYSTLCYPAVGAQNVWQYMSGIEPNNLADLAMGLYDYYKD